MTTEELQAVWRNLERQAVIRERLRMAALRSAEQRYTRRAAMRESAVEREVIIREELAEELAYLRAEETRLRYEIAAQIKRKQLTNTESTVLSLRLLSRKRFTDIAKATGQTKGAVKKIFDAAVEKILD